MEIYAAAAGEGKTHGLIHRMLYSRRESKFMKAGSDTSFFVCPDYERLNNAFGMAIGIMKAAGVPIKINATELEIIWAPYKFRFVKFDRLPHVVQGHSSPEVFIDDVFDCLGRQYNIQAVSYRR